MLLTEDTVPASSYHPYIIMQSMLDTIRVGDKKFDPELDIWQCCINEYLTAVAAMSSEDNLVRYKVYASYPAADSFTVYC